MNYPVEAIGKKIVSDKEMILFEKFPDSDVKKTILAGVASPIIRGFNPRGFYEVELEKSGYSGYIKAEAGQKFVDKEYIGEPVSGNEIITGVKDWFSNTTNQVKKGAGFLNDGFENAVKDVGIGFSTGLDKLYILLGLVIVIMVLNVIRK